MAGFDRNAPCPCGSGIKSKRCCLARQEAARPRPSRDVEEMREMVESLRRYARREHAFGLEAWLAPIPDELVDEVTFPFWEELVLFHATLPERSAAELYLESGSRVVHAQQCRWRLESWATLLEVTEVRPGDGFVAKDLLTGEVLVIHDVMASRGLHPHAVLMALPFFRGDRCFLASAHPRVLGPREGAASLAAIREGLRERGLEATAREHLRVWEARLAVALAWGAAVGALDNRPEPQMCNTDGDPILLVQEHYSVRPGDRDSLLAAIAGMEGAEEPDATGEAAAFTITRPGNAQNPAWKNTVIGRIIVPRGGRVTIETNSERRADTLRARFEDACGPLVQRKGRELQDAHAALEHQKAMAGPRLGSGIPAAEEARLVREMKERMYATWPDEKLPALGGKTARQAAKGSAKLRADLELLLKDMEFSESLQPEEQRYDFGILRKAIGLPPAK